MRRISKELLLSQAKKCQTPDGAGLLLAIIGHIEGRQVYEDCDELWQVVDVVGTHRAKKTDEQIHKKE